MRLFHEISEFILRTNFFRRALIVLTPIIPVSTRIRHSKIQEGKFYYRFLEPRPAEGPTKSQLSFCLSVCRPSVSSAFVSAMGHYFFLIYCTMVDNGNISKLAEPFFFQENSLMPEFGQKAPKTGRKNFFFNFIKNFFHNLS